MMTNIKSIHSADKCLYPVHERYQNYADEVCWQYHIRVKNLDEDIDKSFLPREHVELLMESYVSDDLLTFAVVEKTDKVQCREVAAFIERYEWLARMPHRTTHRFTARTVVGNVLCGVIVMAVPNAFSSLLGPEYRHREKLVSRGASISWAPHNTASWLLMKAIRWMAQHTECCLYSAYSDPEARELGTIYQACNFYYLGQTSGTDKQYFDPNRPDLGWFSDRSFRHKSKVKQRARMLGITLEKAWWKTKYTLDWTKVPPKMTQALKDFFRSSAQVGLRSRMGYGLTLPLQPSTHLGSACLTGGGVFHPQRCTLATVTQ